VFRKNGIEMFVIPISKETNFVIEYIEANINDTPKEARIPNEPKPTKKNRNTILKPVKRF